MERYATKKVSHGHDISIIFMNLEQLFLFEQDLRKTGSTNGSSEMGKNHKAHLPKGVGVVS